MAVPVLVPKSNKTCPTCGGDGPFSKDRTRKDGLSRECKSCAKNRIRGWREHHPGRNAAACKVWSETNLEKKKTIYQRWYLQNGARVRDYARCYAREHKEDRKRRHRESKVGNKAFVISLKEGAHCVDCDETYPTYCMDFDHVRGEKKGKQLSWLYGQSRAVVANEIAKCDLVCACCHRIRTEERRSPVVRSKNKQRDVFRRRLLNLKDRPCVDCGRKLDPRAMEFDHVRGPKVLAVSSLCSAYTPWEEVLAEVSKCEVVCAVCHRKRTEARLWLSH